MNKSYVKIRGPNFKEEYPLKFTEEQIQFTYELKKDGMTYKMIERKTGISIATQKRRFKKILWKIYDIIKMYLLALGYISYFYRASMWILKF